MSRDSSGTAAGSRSRSRSAARGSRPETQRSAAKRRKLISAAHDAFQEKGFAATTIDDIIARAGGSRGTIYLYSGSKLALFETVVREEAERFSATLGQVLSDASNGSADPFAIVEQLFAAATGEEALGLLRTVVAERARFPERGDLPGNHAGPSGRGATGFR